MHGCCEVPSPFVLLDSSTQGCCDCSKFKRMKVRSGIRGIASGVTNDVNFCFTLNPKTRDADDMSSIPPPSWNPYQGRGVQGTATTATTGTLPTSTTTLPTTTTHTTTTASTSSSSSSPVPRQGTPEVPTTASLAYSSWTVPSLDNLFSARRASAFGLRYGLSSVTGTMVGGGGGGGGGVGPGGGRVSPAHSGMSMMMEGGSAGASLQIKARKCMPKLLVFSHCETGFYPETKNVS